MKYYINKNKEIFGFELDGSQDHLITPNMIPITLSEIQAIHQAKENEYKQTTEYKIAEAKAYLSETSWIWEKYSRNVLVLKDLTIEEFNIKYQDIILAQEEARLNINKLEQELIALDMKGAN